MIKHDYGSEYFISFRKVDPEDSEMLKEFECEYDAIRDFIRYQSIKSRKDVSYIFIDEENKIVVGFCAICCSGISAIKTNESVGNYVGIIPAIEIDFFAVDSRYRNLPLTADSKRYETLSSALFLFMIQQIKRIASTEVGATHICLYAVPRAKNFYKRSDFVEYDETMVRDQDPFLKSCIPMFYEI